MGAGASTLPATLDKATAKEAAGNKFDEAAFDAAAVDGVISCNAFLAAAAEEEAAAFAFEVAAQMKAQEEAIKAEASAAAPPKPPPILRTPSGKQFKELGDDEKAGVPLGDSV